MPQSVTSDYINEKEQEFVKLKDILTVKYHLHVTNICKVFQWKILVKRLRLSLKLYNTVRFPVKQLLIHSKERQFKVQIS